MKMKKKIYILMVLLLLFLPILSVPTTTLAESSFFDSVSNSSRNEHTIKENKTAYNNEKYNNILVYNNIKYSSTEIDDLFNQRMEVMLQNEYDKLNEIDNRLAVLGIQKIEQKDIQEELTENEDFTFIPNSNNITWFSYYEDYIYDGITYEIQTLIAQPNGKESSLIQIGSQTVPFVYKQKSDSVTLFSFEARTPIEKISDFSFDLTTSNKKNGIPETEIAYLYIHITTANFKYVKVKDSLDVDKKLAFISTKGNTVIYYQYPTFIYSDDGNVYPDIGQGRSCIITSAPFAYGSNYEAIQAYHDIYACNKLYLSRIEVTDTNNKKIFEIAPICPQFPLQIS